VVLRRAAESAALSRRRSAEPSARLGLRRAPQHWRRAGADVRTMNSCTTA